MPSAMLKLSNIGLALAAFCCIVRLDAQYDGNEFVTKIDSESFDRVVMLSDTPWLLVFSAPRSVIINILTVS